MDNIKHILIHIFDIFIILAPTIGYIDTMRIMIKTRRSDIYNINTVLIIYFAQGTKVLFYFYHRYATRILCQAIMLLLSASILTLLKFLYCEKQIYKENRPESQNDHRRESIDRKRDSIDRRRESIDRRRESIDLIALPYKPKSFKDFFNIAASESLFYFIVSYIIYFTIVYSSFQILYFKFGTKAVDFLGIISNLAEASTSFPTFIRVVIHKDALTTSPLLVLQYFLGDIMKIGVYSISKAPWSFFFGAFCQLSVDIITNITFLILKIKSPKKNQSDSENSPLMDANHGDASVELEDA